MISRHFVDVAAGAGTRRVHYRRAGTGPAVVLVHQSPRSSLEYERLLHDWSDRFTLFAPDTPGFGASDPLPVDRPEVEDYADAMVALMDALGLGTAGAYGFHSGAITLITAAKRHPGRFSAVAAGGYAVWTEAEKAAFAERYTPPFVPQPYGEHLAWLWPRIVEQSWFFPWYSAQPGARLKRPTDDPAAVQPVVMEMLEAGDNYRRGYGAVLRASRDVPEDGAPPTLITAYDGDPLQTHITRLGALPANWQAYPVGTPAELEAACRAHLEAHPAPAPGAITEAADEDFVAVRTAHFDGLIHRRVARLHAPGSSARVLGDAGALCLDLPGHGLSDGWTAGGAPTLGDWVEAVVAALPERRVTLVGDSWSGLLALAVAAAASERVAGVSLREAHLPRADAAEAWRAGALPDLTPDRHGGHLLRGWHALRAATFFWPPFRVAAETAIPFDPAEVEPERLRVRHLALMQARAAGALLDVLIDADRDALLRGCPAPLRWQMADWAKARDDIWKPEEQA
jgi:pimeloyl-ACP methyl ester carboxylesterase